MFSFFPFLDGITWILSHDYIGVVCRILNHGSKTPNFIGHFQWRKRMYDDWVEVPFPDHCNSELVDWCPEVGVAADLSYWPCTEGNPTSVGRGCSMSWEDHEGAGWKVWASESETPYQAEFQTCRKKPSQGWAEFVDDLKTLEDKGLPELQDEAREQLLLQIYLQQLDPPTGHL